MIFKMEYYGVLKWLTKNQMKLNLVASIVAILSSKKNVCFKISLNKYLVKHRQ